MRTLWPDLRYAARSLRRSPYVAITAALSIGVGVGSATAVYSWMDGLVLHPFPATADQGRLVGLEVGEPNGGMGAWSYQTFTELREGTRAFTGMAAWRIGRVAVREPGEQGSAPMLATLTSGNYFDVLGVRAILGRTVNETDVASVAPVAVLGFQLWKDRYDGSASVLGKTLLLNGQPFTVIGVAPRYFSGVYTGVVPQLYVPMTVQPSLSGLNLLDDRKLRSWLLFARLAPGVSIEAARREADRVAQRISAGYGDRPAPGATVMELRVQFLGATLSPLFTAMLAVAALLVALAAANVASLLLVRADARRAEIALRRAIGASRAQVIRVVLIESALLAAAGSALGVATAYLARGALYAFVPRGAFPISLPIPISWRVLASALGSAIVMTVACAVAPALAAMRVSPESAMRSGGRGLTLRGAVVRSAIVSGQLALCIFALVVAGMFVRGFQSAAQVDVGFSDPEHVLLVDTDFGSARLTDERGVAALDLLMGRVRALPGVRSASVASMVPLGFGGRRVVEIKVEGLAPPPGADMSAERAHVGSEYAATMGITVVRGREFRAEDRAGAEPVAMVNEAFVRRWMPSGEAIGSRVDAGRGWATIVGVLHDGKYDRLDEPLHPVVYVPAAQWFVPSFTVHVRTAGDPLLLSDAVRRALLAVNVDLPALQPRTLAEHISSSTFVARTGGAVVGAFAVAALFLSAVGLYGALAFSLSLRRREFAIRLALGASDGSIAWSVARQALVIALAGIAVGAVLSIGGGALMRQQISSMAPGDPFIILVSAVVLLIVVALAARGPVRHALRVEPAAALRRE